MKVLLDEGVPHNLRPVLVEHDVFTTSRMGWAGVRNGALLQKAEQYGFKVFVTADQNLSYQQNLRKRAFGVVVLSSNRWPLIRPGIAKIAEAVRQSMPGSLIRVEL